MGPYASEVFSGKKETRQRSKTPYPSDEMTRERRPPSHTWQPKRISQPQKVFKEIITKGIAALQEEVAADGK